MSWYVLVFKCIEKSQHTLTQQIPRSGSAQSEQLVEEQPILPTVVEQKKSAPVFPQVGYRCWFLTVVYHPSFGKCMNCVRTYFVTCVMSTCKCSIKSSCIKVTVKTGCRYWLFCSSMVLCSLQRQGGDTIKYYFCGHEYCLCERNLDQPEKKYLHNLLNIQQESHQSAEQLRQQFMQTKMQGQTVQGHTIQGQGQTMQGQMMQGQGQVREHVIHQQGAQQQQHATMNGHVVQHGRCPHVCLNAHNALKNRKYLFPL